MSLSSTNTTPMGHADPLNCLQKIGNFLQAPTHSLVRKRDGQKNCLVKALLAVLIAVTSPLTLVGITFFKLGTSCSPSLAGRALSSDNSSPTGLAEQVLEQLREYEKALSFSSKKRPNVDECNKRADALISLMDKLPKTLPQTASSADIEIATTLLREASISKQNYERFADSWNLVDKLRDDKDFFEKVKKAVIQSFSGGLDQFFIRRLAIVNVWLESKNLPRMDV